MTDLRKAAEAVLERWDSPAWEWKKQGPTADLMAALRTALAAEQPSEDIKALRRDAERYRWVLGWLVRTGLLSCKACRIDTPESYGNWWILRKPWSIDDGSFVAYGADLKDTIDAAMEEDKT